MPDQKVKIIEYSGKYENKWVFMALRKNLPESTICNFIKQYKMSVKRYKTRVRCVFVFFISRAYKKKSKRLDEKWRITITKSRQTKQDNKRD